MEVSKATIGIVAAACITAGAAGAFVATRSAAPTRSAQSTESTTGDASPVVGVEQSEAVIAETPTPPDAEPPVVEPPVVEAPVVQPPAARPAAPARVGARPAPATPAAGVRLPERRREASSNTARVAPPAPSTPYEAPRPASPVVNEPSQVAAAEPVRPYEPPAPQLVDLVVSADSVLGLQVETALTSERARVEDEVVARVTRDVRVGDRVAIPAGAKAHGEVTLVERGGKVRDKARLGIRFTSVVLADGTRVPVDTETIYREGDGPGGESAAKIGGGAIGGAIIGGIFGGAKGAVIGATAGGGAGTAAVMAGGRNAATLPSGTPVTVRLVRPATVTIQQE